MVWQKLRFRVESIFENEVLISWNSLKKCRKSQFFGQRQCRKTKLFDDFQTKNTLESLFFGWFSNWSKTFFSLRQLKKYRQGYPRSEGGRGVGSEAWASLIKSWVQVERWVTRLELMEKTQISGGLNFRKRSGKVPETKCSFHGNFPEFWPNLRSWILRFGKSPESWILSQISRNYKGGSTWKMQFPRIWTSTKFAWVVGLDRRRLFFQVQAP